mgnify:CR=1 FL=1
MSTPRLVGLTCSLRTGSVNAMAARAATGLMSDVADLALHDIADVRLFHGDAEEAGPPPAVVELYDAVRPADGIVLFSPEYNSSLPAVTKNLIDWLSRDPTCWDGTGITMVSMSPGGRAGLGAREHFEAIMPRQATRLFPTIGFGNYGDRISDGELTDAATLDELGSFLAEFAAFCTANDGG